MQDSSVALEVSVEAFDDGDIANVQAETADSNAFETEVNSATFFY